MSEPKRQRDWNHLIVVLGQPGTGKSTYALKRAKALCKSPAYGLAHDPGWRLPDDDMLVRHPNFDSASQGLAQRPGAIHSLSVSDGEAVLSWGIDIAKASMEAGANCPVIVLLDEGVSTSGLNPYRMSPNLRDFIATRRHHNVGMIVTIQSPAMGHYQLLGLSTEIVMFRLIDEKGLKRLESIGVPRNTLDRVRKLPDYQNILFNSQKPGLTP